MTIAFCFLTIGDLKKGDYWKSFFANVESNKYNIYINNKIKIVDPYFQKYVIPNRYTHTKWAHISLIIATLKLFQEALKEPTNEYFVLLSDSCIPIVSFNKVEEFILSNDSNIFQNVQHTSNSKGINQRFKNADLSYITKDVISKASQWTILKRDFVEFCVKNVDLINKFGTDFWCPDEHYFIVLCIKNGFQYKSIDYTFMDWNTSPCHPKVFTNLKQQQLIELQQSYLFLRKVSPKFCIIK